MSKAFDTAELIKTRLESLAALQSVKVLIDRQLDINSVVSQAVAKLTGCVTILYTGGSVPNDDGRICEATYDLTLYTRPILRPGQTPADDMVEAMLAGLHDYPLESSDYCAEFLQFSQKFELEPNKTFLIYTAELSARIYLPQPTLITP